MQNQETAMARPFARVTANEISQVPDKQDEGEFLTVVTNRPEPEIGILE